MKAKNTKKEYAEEVVSFIEMIASLGSNEDYKIEKSERAQYVELVNCMLEVGIDNTMSILIAATNFFVFGRISKTMDDNDIDMFNLAKKEIFEDWNVYNERLASIVNSKNRD